jgi:hypothetical protein
MIGIDIDSLYVLMVVCSICYLFYWSDKRDEE